MTSRMSLPYAGQYSREQLIKLEASSAASSTSIDCDKPKLHFGLSSSCARPAIRLRFRACMHDLAYDKTSYGMTSSPCQMREMSPVWWKGHLVINYAGAHRPQMP